jgi:murein DD-endopeptidase MepM/ murein hydrolase activator NlpD
LRTSYGHTAEFYVKRGQEIERGQRIASVGSTGRSTGPHVHYTVEVRGRSVNPSNYIFE